MAADWLRQAEFNDLASQEQSRNRWARNSSGDASGIHWGPGTAVGPVGRAGSSRAGNSRTATAGPATLRPTGSNSSRAISVARYFRRAYPGSFARFTPDTVHMTSRSVSCGSLRVCLVFPASFTFNSYYFPYVFKYPNSIWKKLSVTRSDLFRVGTVIHGMLTTGKCSDGFQHLTSVRIL